MTKINQTTFGLKLLCLIFIYAFFAKSTIDFFASNDVVSIIWPCSGLALAVLLKGGNRYWPGIFIGGVLGNMLAGNPSVMSALMATGNTLEALVGCYFLLHSQRFKLSLKEPEDYLILAIVAAVCASISAVTGILTLLFWGQLTQDDYLLHLLYWWQGDFLGIILVTPLILVWQQPFPEICSKRGKFVEAFVCFGLAWLFGQIIFLGWFNALFGPMMEYWTFLFFVWASVRFGRHGALLIIFITTIQGLLGIVRHAGFFGSTIPENQLMNFWCYTLVLSTIGMILALITYEKEQAKRELGFTENKFRLMFDLSPIGIARNAMDGRYIEVNAALLDMLGYSLDELEALSYWDITPKEYGTQEMLHLADLHENHRYGPYEKEYFHKDGHRVAIRLNGRLVNNAIDEPYILSTIEDISERNRNDDDKQIAALIYQNSSEAIMITDAQDTIIAINAAFTQLTGYTPDDIIGKTPNVRNSGRQEKGFYKDLWGRIIDQGHWEGEIWNRRKSGETCSEWLNINTIFDAAGAVYRRVAMFSDISEKKAKDDMIWRQANFDDLTALPNRRMFNHRLNQDIEKARCNNQQLGLLLLDLDQFKEINDSLGHNIGDELLSSVAARLADCVRKIDILARLGGDEFAVVLTELDQLDFIEYTVQCIFSQLSQPFTLQNSVVHTSVSIGIAVFPENAGTGDELFKYADQALYSAKAHGRSQHCYFNFAMQEAMQLHMKLVNDLHTALAEKQFCLVYQPIIDLSSGHIVKAEALVRWNHPTLGQVSPVDFIPIAEETGMIIELGEWIFLEAARQAQHWRAIFHPDFQISINKSPVQFKEKHSYHENWGKQLLAMGWPGQSIVAEITESMLLDNNEFINNKLLSFRDANIQVALDDFGTGYSSLSYLKKFHIDYLKIDQLFIRNMTPHSEDLVLCEAIIVMANKLGIKVIAEGIETAEQRDLLTAAGCDFGQGFWFAKPLSPEQFENQLFPKK